MLIQPKDRKYRKSFKRGKKKGREKGELTKGEYGLKAREGGRVSARQREAGRKRRRNKRNRRGKVWVEVFPDRPVTKKPREVRMGGGKGSVEYWAGNVRTRTYERQKGTVPGGTKRARVRMGEEVAKTTVGTRGVRVEYCYGRG